ncbi:MAG: sigma-70 family RNA polymerase sigma factor [Phycisphaerales bacterium JB063]
MSSTPSDWFADAERFAQRDAGESGAAKPRGRDRTELFLSLLMTHQRRVHAFILSMVPNRNDADDLLQETIVVMWRKFDSFEVGTDFVAWSMSIARYEVLQFRQKFARSKLVFSESLLESLAEASMTSAAKFDERHDALELCLHKLTDQDRELISLRYRDGLSIRAVAQRVGRPTAGMYKAMARIHTALSLCVRRAIGGLNHD